MDPELASLLDLAEATSTDSELFEYLDPIARHRDAAIAAVRSRRWLESPRLGRFAVRVISRAVVEGASKKKAVRVLALGLTDAGTPRIREDAIKVLDRLDSEWQERDWEGSNREDDTRLTERLRDTSWPRRYMHAWTLWHLVVDETALPDGRRRFLSACHRWNSEEYVNSGSRRLAPTVDEKSYCSLCDRSDRRGWASASGRWRGVMAPWNEEEQLHLLRARAWHLVEGKSPLDAAFLGRVYLTECGWWIEGPRVEAEGPADERSPICESCVRFAKSGATEESETEDGEA